MVRGSLFAIDFSDPSGKIGTVFFIQGISNNNFVVLIGRIFYYLFGISWTYHIIPILLINHCELSIIQIRLLYSLFKLIRYKFIRYVHFIVCSICQSRYKSSSRDIIFKFKHNLVVWNSQKCQTLITLSRKITHLEIDIIDVSQR